MPGGEATGGRHEIEVADSGMVMMFEGHSRLESPVAPVFFPWSVRQDPAVGENHYPVRKMVLCIKVNRNPGNNVFPRGEIVLYGLPPLVGQIVGVAVGNK